MAGKGKLLQGKLSKTNDVVLTLSLLHQTLLSLGQLLPLHGQLALVECPVKELS